MSEELASWWNHPLTITLLVSVTAVLFAVSELLLRSLADLGNVRFQGLLEENPCLFVFCVKRAEARDSGNLDAWENHVVDHLLHPHAFCSRELGVNRGAAGKGSGQAIDTGLLVRVLS